MGGHQPTLCSTTVAALGSELGSWEKNGEKWTGKESKKIKRPFQISQIASPQSTSVATPQALQLQLHKRFYCNKKIFNCNS
jgi:hypothetical protein